MIQRNLEKSRSVRFARQIDPDISGLFQIAPNIT